MSAGTGHVGGPFMGRRLGNLPAPKGLIIQDGNEFSDEENLGSLARSNVIATAGFDHLELTLTRDLSATIPHLLRGVSLVCAQLQGIRVLLVKLSQGRSGSANLRLGCHISNLLKDFGDNKFTSRLDFLPEDRNLVHYSLQGSSQGNVDQRLFGTSHWDPYHHHLGLGRSVPRMDHFLSLTLSCLRLTDNNVSNFPDVLHNLHTLPVAFNLIMDAGLLVLLRLDPMW